MKFLRFALPIAIAMATMAAAMPSNNLPTESLSVVKAQLVSSINIAVGQLQAQDAKLKSIKLDNVSLQNMEPITQTVVQIVDEVGAKLSDALQQVQNIHGDAHKRQALLVPAINQLVVDLNVVLCDLEPLVRHLTANLELGTVQDIVDGLTPALTTLIVGVEGLLESLAPGLSSIVDPLLHTVYGLTDALGLPLNLPSIPAAN